MISPDRLDLMQRQWVRLFAEFGLEPGDVYPLFDQLVAAYSEPHRHYHTLEHLGEMFRVAGRLPVTDPGSLHLAIWFHDAVYDPKARDNEARSADLARTELTTLGIADETLTRVDELIRATAHFTDESIAASPDTAALLDADLAILATPEARYHRYAADIRAEYAFVPDAEYRAGRAAVLSAFLARPRIYHTERMFAEGEAVARQNLQAELVALGASV